MRGTKTTTVAMSWTMLVFVVALCMPFLSAQTENSASSKKDNSVYDELAKAPKKERARRNPLDKKLRCAAPRGAGVDSPGGWGQMKRSKGAKSS
jgi:hypothetical protein